MSTPSPRRTSNHEQHTVHHVRLRLVSIDPRLAVVPMMNDVAAKFLGAAKPDVKRIGKEMEEEARALFASLDELGILEPIKAYREGRSWVAVDGRHRLEWARKSPKAGVRESGTKVPLIEVSKDEAAQIIEASVIGRRHWTKGQRAWLGVLQHPQVCEASEGRPSKENADSIGVSTAPALAARIGVSADTVNQAVTLYRLFYAPGMSKASAAAIEAAARREKYEHLIWGGSGLGAIIAGIGGGQATEDKPKAPTGFHHLEAPMKALLRLGKVYAEWSAEERQKAQQLVTQLVRGDEETGQPGLSEEFRLFLGEALAAA